MGGNAAFGAPRRDIRPEVPVTQGATGGAVTVRQTKQIEANHCLDNSDACLIAYFKLYRQPFIEAGMCLPVFPSPPSNKMVSFAKGTAFIGTAGFGFVQATPVAANNVAAVTFSSALFAGVATAIVGVGTVVVSTNSAYADADFGVAPLYQQRCILAALRVRYVGQELTRGGTVIPFVNPEHCNLNGSTVAAVLAHQGVQTLPVNRAWHTIRWTPVYDAELQYAPDSHTQNPPATDLLDQMVVLLTGAAGNAFEWEFVCHHEIIGANARYVTNSYSNPWAKPVLSAATRLGQGPALDGSIWQTALEYVPRALNIARYMVTSSLRAGRAARPLALRDEL